MVCMCQQKDLEANIEKVVDFCENEELNKRLHEINEMFHKRRISSSFFFLFNRGLQLRFGRISYIIEQKGIYGID